VRPRCKVTRVARTDREDPCVRRFGKSRVAAGLAVLVVVLLAAPQFADALANPRQFVGRVLLGGASPACAAAIRAYALALTDPVALEALVRDNAPFFAVGGGAIACYRRFAAVLANDDLTRIEALRDRAEAERQTGLRFDGVAYTTDLAETVQQLSDALPALAKGDDAPFRATNAYDSAQAYLALLRRAPDTAAGIAVLVEADMAVLRELAERLDPQP
jgi:hypothetical protein